MFLDRPFDHIGSERTSRDVCRAACAIERPAPSGGHRWIVPACALAALALFALLAMEKFA